jgi:hypothetical protein
MNLSTQDRPREQRMRTTNPVDWEEMLRPASQGVRERATEPLSFLEIGYGYRPGRSSLLSITVHLFALLLIVFSSTHFAYVRAAEIVTPRVEPVRLDEAIYLLGGGSEGIGKQGGGQGSEQRASEGVRARSRRGFAYPGPRPLVSDPPRATLGMQTILQPMLKHPPLLTQSVPLALPNLIEPPATAAPPEPPKPVLKVQSGRLASRPVEKSVQAPKVALSAAASSSIPDLKAPDAVMPQAPPPKPITKLAEASDLPLEGRGQRGVLVLNAVPPPPDVSGHLPFGEVRANFAVAPGEVTVIADPASGSKNGANALMTAGNGGAVDVASGDALADIASGGGSGKGSAGSGSGSGARYGAGRGSGLNSDEGRGTGRGMAAGAGTGSDTGTVLGSGKGAGSAPTTGGFPGISVIGGRYGNGGSASGSVQSVVTSGGKRSYAMTIASTASSGGGLADFGVFHDEKVYTNYIDMRANDDDTSPSWILQYAVLQPTPDPANPGLSARIVGTPTAPFPTLKQVPQLPPDLAARCVHKLIVVSALMNFEGKLENIAVRQTPAAEVNAKLTEALSNWTFQPAEIDGQPVALKILLGIRLVAQ